MIYFNTAPQSNGYTLIKIIQSSSQLQTKLYRQNKTNKDVLFYQFMTSIIPSKIIDKMSKEINHFVISTKLQNINISRIHQAYFDNHKITQNNQYSKVYLKTYEQIQVQTDQYLIINDSVQMQLETKMDLMLKIMQIVESLHRNQILHRNIIQGNIFYHINDEIYMLGLPKFQSIAKWLRKQKLLQSKSKSNPIKNILISPQQLNNNSYSKQTDIWYLGIFLLSVFLQDQKDKQMLYKKQNIQQNRQQYNKKLEQLLDKIQNKELKQLLNLMLRYNKQDRINIEQCLFLVNKHILNNIPINQKQPIKSNQSILPLNHFQLNCYHVNSQFQHSGQFVINSTSGDRIKQVQVRRLSQVLRMYLIQEKFIIEVSRQGYHVYYQFLTSDIMRQVQIYQFKDFLIFFRQMQFIIRQLSDGCLRFYFDIDSFYKITSDHQSTILQNFIKKSTIHDRIVHIQSQNKHFMGILLHNNILLLPASSIINHSTKKYIQNVKITFNFNELTYSNSYISPQFMEQPIKNIHKYDIALVRLNQKIVSQKYLFFIKDYEENILLERIEVEYQGKDVQFGYFIQDQLFKIDQIDFNYRNKTFTIKKSKLNNTLTYGAPLCLILSTNKTFIIGIYQQKNKGIIFNQEISFIMFQCYLFKILTQYLQRQNVNNLTLQEIEQQNTNLLIMMSFGFIKLQTINFDDADMMCLNPDYCSRFKMQNGLTTEDSILQYLQIFEHSQGLQYNKAMCSYLLSSSSLFQPKQKNQFLQQSLKYFTIHYKTQNLLSLILEYKIIYLKQLLSPYNINKQQLYNKCKDIVKSFQKKYYNPYLNLRIYLILSACSNGIQLYSYVDMAALLYRRYGLEQQYRKNIVKFVNSQNYQLQNPHNYAYYLKQFQISQKNGNKSTYQHLSITEMINKIDQAIKLKLYPYVLFYLRRLFILNENVYGYDVKNQAVVNKWKQIVVSMIKYSKFVREIECFQEISQEYYREGYLHLKQALNKKKHLIENQQKQRQLNQINQ